MRALVAPVVLLAALIGGIEIGESLGGAPAIGALAIGAAATFIALALRGRSGLVAVVLGIVLIGAASMQRALDGLEHSKLSAKVASYRATTTWVTLIDDPGNSRFVVDVLARVEGAERIVLLVARGDAAGRLRILRAGDRARLTGSLRPLSGFDARMRWRHAVGELEVTRLDDFVPARSPLLVVANALRGFVVDGTASMPATERALVAGLVLGDTRAIPRETVDDFRESGLTHHLAVSGENVAFVLALAGPLLRRLGLRTRFVTGLALLVVFGAMTRWEPSVLRAIAMAGFVMLATLLGRPTVGLRVLALSAGALLLADPFLVHSVGFGLSCCATAGIAVLAGPIAAHLPGPGVVREPVAIAGAAQLGVAPLLLLVFGGIPAAAVPANLLAAPLVGPITVWGLGVGALGGVARRAAPGPVAFAQLPATVLARALEGVARAAAGLSFPLDARGCAAAAAVGLALYAGSRVRRSHRRAVPVASTAMRTRRHRRLRAGD